jgi:hypothetical protein
MMMKESHLYWLAAGDIFTFALVTIVGFSRHGEVLEGVNSTLSATLLDMMSTFLPLVFAWWMIAPFLGAYDLQRASDPRQLWRPFWAMVLAGPMAAWLRGVWLGRPVILIFVVVIGGVSALALFAWRGLFLFLISIRKRRETSTA